MGVWVCWTGIDHHDTLIFVRKGRAIDFYRSNRLRVERIGSISLRATIMNATTGIELTRKRCAPCEGGVPTLTPSEVETLLKQLDGWRVTANGKRIRREWKARNFSTAIHFFDEVAALAEAEGHHPDLHLTGYREVAIEITTHAIGGLSENDFILAAKIDAIPFEVKKN
jgi:4a-hydroxytetrahydrobiopterin dehydratase